jgi:hypothetical protein
LSAASGRWADAAKAFVVVLPLATLLWLSGAVGLLPAFGAMALATVVLMCTGRLVLRAADATELGAPAAWVAGLFVTGISIYLSAVLFQVLAATAFAVWALLVLALAFALRRGRSAVATTWTDAPGLALCGLATWLWCGEIAGLPQLFAGERVFPAWIDYFIHGGVISQLGDWRAADRLSIDLADVPAGFYHFASYAVPAAFAAPLDMPGLPLATSVWLPLGFFTLCAGAFALGDVLAGRAGGMAALAAVALVPDASNYGLRNGFFSFHWNLVALPGAGYGTGVCLLSMALLARWMSTRSARTLAAGACLAGGALLYRANIFLLAFPAWLAAALFETPLFRARRSVFLALGIGVLGAAVFAFYGLTDFLPALELFLDQVHRNQEPTGYTGWYRSLSDSYGRGVAVPLGLLLVFPAGLGIFALLFPLSLLLAYGVGRLRPHDAIPLFLLAGYAVLLLIAPVSAHGDSTEFTHRPFVVLYAAVAAWTAAGLVNCAAAAIAEQHIWRAVLALSLIGLVLMWPQAGAMTRPKFRWGWVHVSHKAVEGLPEAAAFLRRNARVGDEFGVAGLKLGFVDIDTATQLAALSGMPAYLARPFMQAPKTGRQAIALERYKELGRVARADTASAAARELSRLGVQWFVVIGTEGPSWDRQRRAAVFTAGRVAVYAAGRGD